MASHPIQSTPIYQYVPWQMKPVMPCGSSNYFNIIRDGPDFVGHAGYKNSVELICTKNCRPNYIFSCINLLVLPGGIFSILWDCPTLLIYCGVNLGQSVWWLWIGWQKNQEPIPGRSTVSKQALWANPVSTWSKVARAWSLSQLRMHGSMIPLVHPSSWCRT